MGSKIKQIEDNIVIKNLSDDFQEVLAAYPEELSKYELSDFVNALLKEDENVETGFVSQLIASYDKKKRTAKISGHKLTVTKEALTAALHLPVTLNADEGDDDEDATPVDFSNASSARFLYQFVMGWMYLNSEQKMVAKVHKMSHCIMRGHPEAFDFSGFMWALVENEILKGTAIKECYYAPHMQCLIRNQLSDLFFTPGTGNGNGNGNGDAAAAGSETRSAPVESEISGSGKNQFKRRRRNNYKAGTASGSDSRGNDLNSGSPSSASSTSRGHDVNPGSRSSTSSE